MVLDSAASRCAPTGGIPYRIVTAAAGKVIASGAVDGSEPILAAPAIPRELDHLGDEVPRPGDVAGRFDGVHASSERGEIRPLLVRHGGRENRFAAIDFANDAAALLVEHVVIAGGRSHMQIFADGRRREIPFLQLPISQLPSDFFPLTCRSCVDYTNVLADITVGYMGGQGEQWLLVRNARGEELLRLLGDEISTAAPGSAGKRAGAVKGFLENTRRAAGGLPLRRMPDWLRPIIGWLMPRIGPRGLEFARARVEMKAVESVLHLERAEPAKMRNMVPDHVWALVAPYGLKKPDQPSAR